MIKDIDLYFFQHQQNNLPLDQIIKEEYSPENQIMQQSLFNFQNGYNNYTNNQYLDFNFDNDNLKIEEFRQTQFIEYIQESQLDQQASFQNIESNNKQQQLKQLRLLKRTKAKLRVQRKKEQQNIVLKQEPTQEQNEIFESKKIKFEDSSLKIQENSQQLLSEDSESGSTTATQSRSNKNKMDEQCQKLKQKIRNRISAQNSRDRKRNYIQDLQEENKQLQQQNSQLNEELEALKLENSNLFVQLNQTRQSENFVCKNCNSNKDIYFQPINFFDEEEDQKLLKNNQNHDSSNFGLLNFGRNNSLYSKIGLAFFACIAMVCLITIPSINNQDGVTILTQTSNNQDLHLKEGNKSLFEHNSTIEQQTKNNQISTENEKQNYQIQEFQWLQSTSPFIEDLHKKAIETIENLRQSKENNLPQINQKIECKSFLQNEIRNLKNKYKSIKAQQQQQSSSEINLYQHQIVNMPTIICNSAQMLQSNIKNQIEFYQDDSWLQKSEWMHLLIPSEKLKYVEFSPSFEFQVKEQEEPQEMYEFVCKIEKIRKFRVPFIQQQ